MNIQSYMCIANTTYQYLFFHNPFHNKWKRKQPFYHALDEHLAHTLYMPHIQYSSIHTIPFTCTFDYHLPLFPLILWPFPIIQLTWFILYQHLISHFPYEHTHMPVIHMLLCNCTYNPLPFHIHSQFHVILIIFILYNWSLRICILMSHINFIQNTHIPLPFLTGHAYRIPFYYNSHACANS